MPQFINVRLPADEIGPMIEACRCGSEVIRMEFGTSWDADWLEDLANILQFYQILHTKEADNG